MSRPHFSLWICLNPIIYVKTSCSNAPLCDFEMVNLVADGLQVALLGETGQQSLHAAVELPFTIKLEAKEKEERMKYGDKK